MTNITRLQPNTTKQTPQIIGKYIALLSQAGTAAPTAVVIKNTLPTEGMPVWSRLVMGAYEFRSAVTGYFPAGLVTFVITRNLVGLLDARMEQTSTENMTVVTTDGPALADSVLAFTPIEITIWDRLQD